MSARAAAASWVKPEAFRAALTDAPRLRRAACSAGGAEEREGARLGALEPRALLVRGLEPPRFGGTARLNRGLAQA